MKLIDFSWLLCALLLAPVSSMPAKAEDRKLDLMQIHKTLTAKRVAAYKELFESKPVVAYPYHQFTDEKDILIDVFVYEVEAEGGTAYTLITNGLSDVPLTDEKLPGKSVRIELVQYRRDYSQADARRLWEDAWLPRFDKFIIQHGETISWPASARPGTLWKNVYFIEPLPKEHRLFRLPLLDGVMALLWDVPISDDELVYKKQHGSNDFLDLMDKKKLPWVFDEKTRTSMVLDAPRKKR